MSLGIVSYRPSVSARTHMVSSGHYLATAAGYRILEQGGNAIDAGVASGIAINVTLPHMTCFGGVAPIMVYLAEAKKAFTISGLGRWPKGAPVETFNGEMPPGLGHAVVPAACDAWLTALENYGTMTFKQVVTPALELAENGFPISKRVADAISGAEERLSEWPQSASVFMPRGVPLSLGEKLVNPDLASLFRSMIDVEESSMSAGREAAIRKTRDYFYKGEPARLMAEYCRERGGFLNQDDLSSFRVGIEEPLVGDYKGHRLLTCGPWCQGPSLIQVLQLLEGFDIKDMAHNSPEYLHLIVEAIKLAFADRHAYYGDPDFVDVPLSGLLSKAYAKERSKLIDQLQAAPGMPSPGDPWQYQTGGGQRSAIQAPASLDAEWEPDTSYTCVIDRWGNAFSATPSDGQLGEPLVPGLGLTISTRGGQAWLDPDHPARVEPWKRPRLTPNPAMVVKDGELFMTFGTPGLDAQVQAMTQVFLNIVEFGMDPQEAIEAPRAISYSFPGSSWPHPYLPGRLNLEGRIDEVTANALESLGHDVERWPDWTELAGGACAILVDRERGILEGGADPRRESYALGR